MNNPICPCVFIKKSETGFSIIVVYVYDLNLVGTPKELTKTAEYLKNEFEMKDLGKTKFCIGLQIEHFLNGVLVHQSTYIKNYLVPKYHILVPLMHLCILLIVQDHILLFSVNLLARYSSAPTRRHWKGIQHILRYLSGTTDMGLYYSNK